MRIKKLPLFYKIFFAVLLVLTAAAAVGIWVLNGILADYEAVHCNCCHHKHQGSKADGKDFSFRWFILFVLLS